MKPEKKARRWNGGRCGAPDPKPSRDSNPPAPVLVRARGSDGRFRPRQLDARAVSSVEANWWNGGSLSLVRYGRWTFASYAAESPAELADALKLAREAVRA
jgi:hypothetical protein